MSHLHFISHHRPGGAVSVAHLLVDRLGGDGAVVALSDLAPHSEAGDGPLRTLRVWWAVLVLLRRHSASAVVTHMPKAALLVSSAAALAGVRRRVRVVHSDAASLGRGIRLLDRVFTRLRLHSDVVFVGEAVRASYGETPAANSRVIRNGIDLPPGLDDGVSTSVSERGAGSTVVSVGALLPSKNLPMLLAACARARGIARLVVVGEGPDRGELEQRAAAVDLDLALPGHLARDQVDVAVRAGDIFAFPTATEALPLALVEAAALGKAVVASDIPANREVLGEAAVYCPVHDVDAWSTALSALAADPLRRQELGRAARERSSGFTLDAMLAEYAVLLEVPVVDR